MRNFSNPTPSPACPFVRGRVVALCQVHWLDWGPLLSPWAFGHYKDHWLTWVCRLLRPIMLRDQLCHLLKTHCSGKKMQHCRLQPHLHQWGSCSRREGDLHGRVLPCTRGTIALATELAGIQHCWYHWHHVDSTHAPSLTLQVKQLKIPPLNPMGWKEGLCRGWVLSLLWAGGFSIVFLQENLILAI